MAQNVFLWSAQQCMKDLMDGYFPSELHERFPDGVPFEVSLHWFPFSKCANLCLISDSLCRFMTDEMKNLSSGHRGRSSPVKDRLFVARKMNRHLSPALKHLVGSWTHPSLTPDGNPFVFIVILMYFFLQARNWPRVSSWTGCPRRWSRGVTWSISGTRWEQPCGWEDKKDPAHSKSTYTHKLTYILWMLIIKRALWPGFIWRPEQRLSDPRRHGSTAGDERQVWTFYHQVRDISTFI